MAHPVRLAVLEELSRDTRCVGDICELLSAPQPNVSQHLAVLRDAGLVNCRKKGTTRCYSLASNKLVRGVLRLLERHLAAGEALLCRRDGLGVDPSRPRCRHPARRCRYRARCPVVTAEGRGRRADA